MNWWALVAVASIAVNAILILKYRARMLELGRAWERLDILEGKPLELTEPAPAQWVRKQSKSDIPPHDPMLRESTPNPYQRTGSDVWRDLFGDPPL